MKRLFACTLLLFAAAPSFAADVNGYTAQYECRAGGPNCNVDVVGLTQQACQQTITTTTAPTNNWSAINWSNTVICVQAGDHSSRGILTLGSSGTSGARKVLRHSRADDNDDEPWNQSTGNKTSIAGINTNGAANWIIHRLAFTTSTSQTKIHVHSSSHDIIINRILQENFYGSSEGSVVIENSDRVVVQNSVLRNAFPMQVNMSPGAILFGNGSSLWMVNNEIYDMAKEMFTWRTSTPTPDAVVENNDLYISSAYRTDCNGNLNSSGDCSGAESVFSSKADGTQSQPYKVIHNRMWGMRPCDTKAACDGGGAGGGLASIGSGESTADWVLFKDNILMDAEDGFGSVTLLGDGTDNVSIIGNIIYKMAYYRFGGAGISYYAYGGSSHNTHEIYLNTFVDIQNGGWVSTDTFTDGDIRCNVIIRSKQAAGSLGQGSQRDFNAYYGTATSGEANNISSNVYTRASAAAYQIGDVLVTGPASACQNGTETACFLYRVTQAGTSASSQPGYCTSLGCTQTDGSIQLTAVRGPYVFYRRLKTGPERTAIPYTRADSSAPESHSCPGNYASRNDIGINNAL